MCGVAGFFTGCPLADTCDQSVCKKRFSVGETFSRWNEKSTVRSAPRRILNCDDSSLDLFPRRLVPAVSHPIFQARYLDRVSEFLALQLYRYLSFTMNLELMVVNENVRHLLLSADELGLGAKERLALHQVYVDEAYHALFCADFSHQLADITGFRPNYHSQPSFMRELVDLTSGAQVPSIQSLVFVCVSETLITHNLLDVAADESIPDSVNDIMRDHAKDESLHHNLFKRLIVKFYQDNTANLRDWIHLIPQSIMSFIKPDLECLRLGLMQIGIGRDEALQILGETYESGAVTNHARHAARDLLQMLQSECAGNIRLQDKLAEYALV